jgi:hypothetical protein
MPPRKAIPLPLAAAPFTVAHAHAWKVGEGRLRGPDLDRPFHGVRMPRSDPVSIEQRCRAYAARMRDCEVFSHRTAALLHGLPLPFGQEQPIHVSAFEPHGIPRSVGVRGHRLRLGGAAIVLVRGLRVVSAIDAWCQLSGELSVRRLVEVGDALVCRRHPPATLDELGEAIDRHTGHRGQRALRAAFALVRSGTDSPAETDLRLDLMEYGLPEPLVNAPIFDASGHLIAIGDLVYARFRVIVEYDGGQHREDARQYARDVDRLEDLAHAGWRVIRFNSSHRGVRRTRRLERVREALLAAGWAPDAAR